MPLTTQSMTGRWERQGNTITLFGLETSQGEPKPPRRGFTWEREGELETAPTQTLRLGARGSAVIDLQRRLAATGFSPGAADGVFGALTDRAVRAFQSARGLLSDGIVGPQTWGALATKGASAPAPSTPYASGPGPGGAVTLNKILAAMRRKGYVVHEEPYRLNIVGVRTLARLNTFDDTLNVICKDDRGNWSFTQSAATTDPGTFYLMQPMNVKGTAIVAPGQYLGSHQLGLHHDEYTALVQRGPMTVVRDADRDDRIDLDTGNPETGVFGINIHRAKSSGTSTTVDKYSAGCQVFASSTDFARFIAQCQRHQERYGNSFDYTLLNVSDL